MIIIAIYVSLVIAEAPLMPAPGCAGRELLGGVSLRRGGQPFPHLGLAGRLGHFLSSGGLSVIEGMVSIVMTIFLGAKTISPPGFLQQRRASASLPCRRGLKRSRSRSNIRLSSVISTSATI